MIILTVVTKSSDYSRTCNVASDLWRFFRILDKFRDPWDDSVACASLSGDETQKVFHKRHTWRMRQCLKSYRPPPRILHGKNYIKLFDWVLPLRHFKTELNVMFFLTLLTSTLLAIIKNSHFKFYYFGIWSDKVCIEDLNQVNAPGRHYMVQSVIRDLNVD